jgi:nucleoside-diphosphate-sugar epimerase
MEPIVLITGAAGRVGTALRRHWNDRYRLRLADAAPMERESTREELVTFDATEPDQFDRVCSGVDTVVHLAADAGSGDFYGSLLPRNIVGAYNAFEAAAKNRCRRVVFAGSIYAVRGAGPEPPIPAGTQTHPQSIYGATKCWGESLARVYSDDTDLSCICVRLGAFGFEQGGDWDPDAPSYGVSARDTAQIFRLCVDVRDIRFAIVHGVSRHRKSWLGLDETCALLGYEPQDGTAFPRA